MVTSIVIIVLSLAMFVYWFRYSCLLILESRLSGEMRLAMDTSNLSYHQLEQNLAMAQSAVELDRLHEDLNRDLRQIQDAMHGCAQFQVGGESLECRILMIDYRLMQAWYAVTRSMASSKAHSALREMSRIVSYMANETGEPMATAGN